MGFDFSDLNGLIVAKYRTRKQFAIAANMSTGSLSMKLNGKTPWTSNEIVTAQTLLGIPPEEICRYFFTTKVHNL
jgi:hypothetical protein